MASWWEAICLFFGLTVYLLILLVIILYVGLCWDEMNLRCFFATLFYFVWCFFFFLYDIMQLKRVTFMFIYSAGEVCAAVILLHEVHVCPSRHLISRLSPPASPQGEAMRECYWNLMEKLVSNELRCIPKYTNLHCQQQRHHNLAKGEISPCEAGFHLAKQDFTLRRRISRCLRQHLTPEGVFHWKSTGNSGKLLLL